MITIKEFKKKYTNKVRLIGLDLGSKKIGVSICDENQSIASQLQIQSIPTVFCFHQGQPVDGFQGNLAESQVKEFIKKIIDLAGPSKDLEEKLKLLAYNIEEKSWDEVVKIAYEIIDDDKENIQAHKYYKRNL